MLNGIAFIGGIHGVGKSTICKGICDATGLVYLSASDVLKWKEINTDNTNKQVVDVNDTQDRLIVGLNSIVIKENRYLLDGHFCLLGTEGNVRKVPLETFKEINPFSLNVITGDILTIKERLEGRDNKQYDSDLLREMQEAELNYAKEVSEILKVKLNIGTIEDWSHIINTLTPI